MVIRPGLRKTTVTAPASRRQTHRQNGQLHRLSRSQSNIKWPCIDHFKIQFANTTRLRTYARRGQHPPHTRHSLQNPILPRPRPHREISSLFLSLHRSPCPSARADNLRPPFLLRQLPRIPPDPIRCHNARVPPPPTHLHLHRHRRLW